MMHTDVHNAHFPVKSKRTSMTCKMHAMKIDTRPDDAKRLEQARKARGFKTAKEAALYFGWNYETYAQHENGNRGLGRAVERYAAAFRTTAAWILFNEGDGPENTVPLVGKIGAGQVVQAISPDPDATVEAPADRKPETVAAIISGDSMLPALRDGWVLYWSKHLPPESMLNQLCVVQLENDDIYVKILRSGSAPGLWTLQSINATVSDITDQVVSWVAPIDWIKPR